MKEALKLALEEMKIANYNSAAERLEAALAQPAQEPVAWHLIEALYPQGERLDIRMGDGSILCDLLPQADGDLWWEGSGTGEKFIDPVHADLTHWRIHSNTTPQQRPWVGLTDEDIYDCFSNDVKTAMRNVEQTLKDKNT